MLYLGIDPGPTTCGLVLYHPAEGRVREADSTLTVDEALRLVRLRASNGTRIAIERVQSAGQPGRSLLETSEVVGRLWQAAAEQSRSVRLLYRREVLAALDVTGRGNRDAMVRQRMLEMHPGGVGTKRAPGPLYGVTGHAWQALAVAVAASILDERERRAREAT